MSLQTVSPSLHAQPLDFADCINSDESLFDAEPSFMDHQNYASPNETNFNGDEKHLIDDKNSLENENAKNSVPLKHLAKIMKLHNLPPHLLQLIKHELIKNGTFNSKPKMSPYPPSSTQNYINHRKNASSISNKHYSQNKFVSTPKSTNPPNYFNTTKPLSRHKSPLHFTSKHERNLPLTLNNILPSFPQPLQHPSFIPQSNNFSSMMRLGDVQQLQSGVPVQTLLQSNQTLGAQTIYR